MYPFGKVISGSSKPYIHFVIENFVPRKLYKELDETFPSPTEGFTLVKNGKWHLQNNGGVQKGAFKAALVTRPAWQNMVLILQSSDFIEHVWGACGQQPQYGPVRVEFSRILPGGQVLPHPDIEKKRLACVWYFPSHGWGDANNGAMEVLQLRRGQTPNYRARWDQVETVRRYAYKPNRLVCIVKSSNSWHGVRPIQGVADRRSVTITIMATEQARQACAASST